MRSEALISYEFASYHVLMAAIGAAIFVAYWAPPPMLRGTPPSAALLMMVGCLVSHRFDGVTR